MHETYFEEAGKRSAGEMRWSSPGATGVRPVLTRDAFLLPLDLEKRSTSLSFQASSCPGLDLRWVGKVGANTQVVFYVTTGLQMEDQHVASENGPSDR